MPCRERLSKRLMLFFTGVQRDAGSVLHEARRRMTRSPQARATIDGLVALAGEVRTSLASGRVRRIGGLLNTSWRLKKRMASSVSNGHLDRLYERAIKAGAAGGKVAGAGGGGCLLLFVEPRSQARVRVSMAKAGLREVPFAIDPEGSRIVHYSV